MLYNTVLYYAIQYNTNHTILYYTIRYWPALRQPGAQEAAPESRFLP